MTQVYIKNYTFFQISHIFQFLRITNNPRWTFKIYGLSVWKTFGSVDRLLWYRPYINEYCKSIQKKYFFYLFFHFLYIQDKQNNISNIRSFYRQKENRIHWGLTEILAWKLTNILSLHSKFQFFSVSHAFQNLRIRKNNTHCTASTLSFNELKKLRIHYGLLRYRPFKFINCAGIARDSQIIARDSRGNLRKINKISLYFHKFLRFSCSKIIYNYPFQQKVY